MHWGVCSRLFYKQKMWSEFLKSDCLKRRLFLWILIKWRLTGLVWRWEAKTQGHSKAKFVGASTGLLSWVIPFRNHRRWKCWSCCILWHRRTVLCKLLEGTYRLLLPPSPDCCCPHSKASDVEGLLWRVSVQNYLYWLVHLMKLDLKAIPLLCKKGLIIALVI